MPQGLNEQHRAKLDAIVQQMEANGEPEDAIRFVVSDFKSKYENAEQPKAAPAKTGGGVPDALPTIMGTLYSIAGGGQSTARGMGLSALGGALGEGARQITRAVQGQWDQVPETAMGRIKQMGREAVGQGAMEGGGRALGRIVAPVAKAAYGLAVRPAKALQKEYGLKNLINQGFADRVMPNALGEGRAGRLVGESRDAATAIANKSQTPINLARVLQKATDDQAARGAREMATAGVAPPTEKIAEQVGNVLKSNPETVTPGRLLELRRGADDIANPAFKQARLPGGAGRVPVGTDASVARSMANAERQTLDDVLGAEWKATNAQTRARMGVMQATKDAAMRPNMLTNILAGGIGAQGAYSDGDVSEGLKRALVFRLALSPSAQAGAAFALPAVAKYGPRVADAASGNGMKDALVEYLLGGQQ